jgi:hypothetical protein
MGYGHSIMRKTEPLHLRAAIPTDHERRRHLGHLHRCARELRLPAGSAPSAFLYGVWAERQAGATPHSGHLRAMFGNSWERACVFAGFERIASSEREFATA